jgi:hypothetical protein
VKERKGREKIGEGVFFSLLFFFWGPNACVLTKNKYKNNLEKRGKKKPPILFLLSFSSFLPSSSSSSSESWVKR